MGGTTDWATDLQKHNDASQPAGGWAIFKEMVVSGQDPKTDYTRNGNWTGFDCTSEYVNSFLDYIPSERWKGLNADSAWEDAIRIWKDRF
jgi:hypothetical protein